MRQLLRGIGWVLFAALLILAAWPAQAIVIRHDTEDAKYRELGKRFPAAVSVLPDGSGVLVGPDWVLTAAHVARGVADRQPRVEAAGQEYEVSEIFIHPDWTLMEHDIALLKLRKKVPGITPVKLYDRSDEVGQEVVFVGRGDFGTGKTGPSKMDRVKRGATNILEEADEAWVYFTFDEPGKATELEGVSGPGDSGGPALVTRDGTVYTVGVSVFADGDGGPGRYGVREGYTRVSTHRDWIETVLSGRYPDKGQAPGSAPRRGGPGGPGGGMMRGRPEPLADDATGQLIRAYVEAYNSNDWTKMDAFQIRHYAKSFLEQTTTRERRERFRRLQDTHLGAIELQGVVAQGDGNLSVLFESAKEQVAEFRFEVSADEPPKIAGIRVALVKIDMD